jgi:ElaB/YqjD/DUF883 family membrane-anchored ribosome-binding protein/uncharacterized protein YjbJ (UPF0337 family)
MSLPKFESEWDGFKGHVAVTWDKLTEEELLRVQGNFAELVKIITAKYGDTKAAVEEKLKDLYNGYIGKKNDLQQKSQALFDALKQKAGDLQSGAKEKYQQLRDESIQPTLDKSEDYIKLHPFTAVLGALGVGLLLGGLIGVLSRKD